MSTVATLVISVRIDDKAAFIAAAQAKAQHEGLSRLAARMLYNDDHFEGCVYLLIEPHDLPAGCDILASDCLLGATPSQPENVTL
jgi:hypothetical protein